MTLLWFRISRASGLRLPLKTSAAINSDLRVNFVPLPGLDKH